MEASHKTHRPHIKVGKDEEEKEDHNIWHGSRPISRNEILNTKIIPSTCRHLATLVSVANAWSIPGQTARHKSEVRNGNIAFFE